MNEQELIEKNGRCEELWQMFHAFLDADAYKLLEELVELEHELQALDGR